MAISYANEDVRVAEALATELTRAGISVFFDRYRQVELWGTSLYDLESVYDRARFVIILASVHYGKRRWTIHERNVARRRATEPGRNGSVLPIALGVRSVPGFESVAHMSLDGAGIDHVIEIVKIKLGRSSCAGSALASTVGLPLPAQAKDGTSVNEIQSHYSPVAYTPLTSQPTGTGGHTGPGASGPISTTIKTGTNIDNRKGIRAPGITAITLVMGTVLCVMGWLAFDVVKSLPRNDDGSVTVWGVITLPASIIGEQAPSTDATEAIGTTDTITTPTGPLPTPAITTRKDIEGVWACGKLYTITFTEAGRAAFSHAGYPAFQKTAFGKWTDQPYTVVSARTIEVGGAPVQVEVSTNGQALRAVGGNRVFDCKKKTL